MLHISYLFAIMNHNMQELNEAAVKCVIFMLSTSMVTLFTLYYFMLSTSMVTLFTHYYFYVEYVYGYSVYTLLCLC